MQSTPDQSTDKVIEFIATGLFISCCLWLILLSMTVLLPDLAWHDAALEFSSKLQLYGFELLLTLVYSAFAACCIVFMRQPLARAIGFIGFSLLILFYCCSWGLYYLGNIFLSSTSITMLMFDSHQIILHILQLNPLILFITISLALCCSLLLYFIIRSKLLSQVSHYRRYWFRCAMLALCCLMFTPLLFVRSQHQRSVQQVQLFAIDQISHYQKNTGPLLYFLADLKRLLQPKLAVPTTLSQPDLAVIDKPLLSMADYLNSINDKPLQRYNVILLLIESLRKDALQIYGNRLAVMPSVDQISQDAIVFNRNYAQASHSNYADLAPLTSRYPLYAEGYYYYPQQASYPRLLIYDILHAIGYRTAIFSSQNESWGGMKYYLQAGHLDHFFSADYYQGDFWTDVVDADQQQNAAWLKTMTGGTRYGKVDDYHTVSHAIKWIRQRSDQPFFLYMNLQNSHMPYIVPAGFPNKFNKINAAFPSRISMQNPSHRQIIFSRYFDSLAYIDQQLKRLTDALKQAKLWDKTILVISADTATAFGEHGFNGNASALFDEVVQVPLLIRIPGHGYQEINHISQHIDIPPTLLSAIGLPPHPSFQGIDQLNNHKPPRYAFIVAQTPVAQQYAIVSDRYKVIYDLPARGSLLFDIKADPGERKPLTDKAKRDPLLANLFKWVQLQLNYYADPLQQKQAYPPSYY